ncbi:bifunctional 4-hydroxy-2-oxoglutarate aldolase/2-dehydro-3-deoxy-phosphogluconate aldolase [Thauera sp.]|uniref:bifunctional 4-hydroxy-2-oxoglutarate aldolase/2-dehydro-3-deoxy-phosphogluconate aldolase n=1 Tax=Thauera sp. TaxID=1905334 RepID=UPI002580D223|nr:bifunctional 4-hydroxy-2-oxoglutarate aldolase/2-dehydro-3-deoxy-phosphogluconate aldolase [Thauera sp.]
MSEAMAKRQQALAHTLGLGPVVAVVVVERLADAVPMAKALVAGGVLAIEVTLRTPVALDAMRAIAAEVEGAHVGAGTVITPADLAAAERAGARFAVSPGATATLVAAAAECALPWLPGVATASEAMAALERGHRHLKLFPAEAAGGTALLRGLHGPLPGLRFCPTGGITPASAGNYLALPNVACVGGSWLTPADRMAAGDWPRIEALAREASALRP